MPTALLMYDWMKLQSCCCVVMKPHGRRCFLSDVFYSSLTRGYPLCLPPPLLSYNKYLLISFLFIISLCLNPDDGGELSTGSYLQKTEAAIFVCMLLILFDERTSYSRSCITLCLGRNSHTEICIRGRNRARDETEYVCSCTIRLTARQKHAEPLFPCNWI